MKRTPLRIFVSWLVFAQALSGPLSASAASSSLLQNPENMPISMTQAVTPPLAMIHDSAAAKNFFRYYVDYVRGGAGERYALDNLKHVLRFEVPQDPKEMKRFKVYLWNYIIPAATQLNPSKMSLTSFRAGLEKLYPTTLTDLAQKFAKDHRGIFYKGALHFKKEDAKLFSGIPVHLMMEVSPEAFAVLENQLEELFNMWTELMIESFYSGYNADPDIPLESGVKEATETVIKEHGTHGVKNFAKGLLAMQVWSPNRKVAEAKMKSINLLYTSGKRIEAIKLMIALGNQYPDISDIFVKLGTYYMDEGKWVQAIEAYKVAVRINPDHSRHNARLLTAVGSFYMASNKVLQGIKAFRAALVHYPGYERASEYLRAAEQRAGPGFFDRIFDKAYDAPNDVEAQIEAAVAAYLKNDLWAAGIYVDRVLAELKDHFHPQVHELFIEILAAKGNFGLAFVSITKLRNEMNDPGLFTELHHRLSIELNRQPKMEKAAA